MTEVTVATAPPLVTVPNVELMHTGQWPISTGIANFTGGDLRNAVAALDCPAVRRPVLKLGHDEPDPDEHGIRWDGEPAVGYITNMAVVENGQTLVGDYTGMPSWLGSEVLASAYPDRSIEGQYDFRCQIGHTHPFVVTAVALLGVVAPGIGTLQSLQDVAALYQVAAAATPTPGSGSSFTVTVHAARQEAAVPNPNPTTVRAGVTTDDVRRAFYESEHGRGYDTWICEIQLSPTTQLIIIDDSTGKLQRVPIMVGDGDGEDAVEFGDPVPVVVRYEDAQVAASAGRQAIVYASREESRPGGPPSTEDDPVGAGVEPQPEQQDPPVPVRAGGSTHQEGAAMDAALLREALGLSPEANDDEVRAALTEQGVTPTPSIDPVAEPDDDLGGDSGEDNDSGDGEDAPAEPVAQQAATPPSATVAPMPRTVTLTEAAFKGLKAAAEDGQAARRQQLLEERNRILDDAVKAGKFPPAQRKDWEKYWNHQPELARAAIADLAPGLVPVEDAGAPGGELTDEAVNAEFDRLFPDQPNARN